MRKSLIWAGNYLLGSCLFALHTTPELALSEPDRPELNRLQRMVPNSSPNQNLEPQVTERQVMEPKAVEKLDFNERIKAQAIRLNEEGLEAVFRGDRTAAAAKLKQALAHDPENPSILFNLAGISLAEKDSQHALAFMKKAVDLEPKDSAYRLRLADAQILSGEHSGAIRTLEELTRQDELIEADSAKNGEIWLKLGTLYGIQHRWDLAENSLRKAWSLLGDEARVLANLGAVLVSQRQYPQAIKVLSRCKSGCESPDTEVALGIAHESTGQLISALDHYQRARVLGDDGKDLVTHIAELQYQLQAQAVNK